MERQLGDLHVKRKAVLEPMLPIEGEAEKIQVEFPRLRFIENPPDGNAALKDHYGLRNCVVGFPSRS